MALAARTSSGAVAGICALLGPPGSQGCEGVLGTSPPHAAPSNPSPKVPMARSYSPWGAVTDATRYVIVWDDSTPGDALMTMQSRR